MNVDNQQCDAYVQEVLKFRKALNLTSVSDAEMFKARFIDPSLAMAEWVPDEGRMLDIGSGMGVPGIPLLLIKPGLVGVLVERRKKRAEFLRHVIRKLHLHAEVYDADINDLPALGVDVCVARAVTEEDALLRMCLPHANHGAVAVLPVPSLHKPAELDEWLVSDEHNVVVDEAEGTLQCIRCYQYVA